MNVLKGIEFLAGIAVLAVAAMLFWNWLMAPIFGLPVISFWLAAGFLACLSGLFPDYFARIEEHTSKLFLHLK